MKACSPDLVANEVANQKLYLRLLNRRCLYPWAFLHPPLKLEPVFFIILFLNGTPLWGQVTNKSIKR